MIDLVVTTLSRKRFSLKLNMNDTVIDLLEQLMHLTGCPINLQVLKFQNGKVDELTVADGKCNLADCGLVATTAPDGMNWACLIRKLPQPPSMGVCELCGLFKLAADVRFKGKENQPCSKPQKVKKGKSLQLPPVPKGSPPALPAAVKCDKTSADPSLLSISLPDRFVKEKSFGGCQQYVKSDIQQNQKQNQQQLQQQIIHSPQPPLQHRLSPLGGLVPGPTRPAAGFSMGFGTPGHPKTRESPATTVATPNSRPGGGGGLLARAPMVGPPPAASKSEQPAVQPDEAIANSVAPPAPPPMVSMSNERKMSGAMSVQAPQARRIRRADLETVGRLGVGAFGLVTLEADRRTGRTYALKAVSKGYLAELRMQYSVLHEKNILQLVDSPFVVRLLATYNGREYVYFLLEAALGGELFTTYERLRLYGSETHARFYVACVTEALAHLHQRNVIYRDLKPENLLLDARGYCKLTDFGLAKVATGMTYTLVGTPDYMAPEMIMRSGHGRSADWWMLGVLHFELLAGRAPFEADRTEQTYELVKKGIDHVQFPSSCRGASADLVRRLCRLKPEERLRAPALRDHLFFTNFDWSALQTLRMQPPFRPTVKGQRDLSNFRKCDSEDPPAVHYEPDGTNWDAGFEEDIMPLKISTL